MLLLLLFFNVSSTPGYQPIALLAIFIVVRFPILAYIRSGRVHALNILLDVLELVLGFLRCSILVALNLAKELAGAFIKRSSQLCQSVFDLLLDVANCIVDGFMCGL